MKSKKILSVLMSAGLLVTLAGCSNSNNNNSSTQNSNQPADYVKGVSLDKPLKVDKEAGTVTVLTKVNGKYFEQSTRHNSVEQSGTNGAKSIFTAFVKPEDFYNALIEIGAKPGENMNANNAETTHVEGDIIDTKVTWNGANKDYDINEVVKDSNGKKIEFHFGGNLKTAKAKNTGCLSCLDSCPVGIISNSTYTYGAVEKRKEVKFTGNQDVLPEDDTYVAVIYSVKK